MNQFKPIFLGTADPNTAFSKLKCACNTQKCIRAGGEHKDLDNVGKDTYHHTFFEMLGNWSFGDYFKTDAISWAWELLTEVYKLPTDHIYATYFGGDEKLGLEAVNEARDIWRKLGLEAASVMPFGCKDYFWEMEDTGSCGRCTEIHFDIFGKLDAASLVNNDDSTCIEVWNLVFIQFNREADGSLKPLPSKHVDTGWVFILIFNAIQHATGARHYSGVVADHIRTLSFAIADGSRPGNEGRGYFLRCILKRGVRYGREVLEEILVELMGDVFPELKDRTVNIIHTITEEETSFERTLLKGIEKFKKAAQELQGEEVLSGQDSFLLWDIYGFPLFLTQLTAEERGLLLEAKGFENAMEEKVGGAIVMDADATSELQKRGVSPTYDKYKFIWNKGNESYMNNTNVGDEVGIVKQQDSMVNKVVRYLTLVCNVQAFGGFVIHIGSFGVETGKISLGDKVTCKVAITGVPTLLHFDFSHGKPIPPNDSRRIESIMNEKIEDEMDVYANDATLADDKRISGLESVFGEEYPDPVRVVAIGRKVEDLLADPDNKEWSTILTEFSLAILSEEGIAKGIRRITAVTTGCAVKAISLEKDMEATPIKADLRDRVSKLEDQIRKARKKKAEANMQKAVKVATEMAETAISDGKAFCISLIDVELDPAAAREAVLKVIEKGLPVMVFSKDAVKKKLSDSH
ncbi:hypothetical protein MKW92_015328 [Papaver armeniacum]|nr:hypothetical protein MKW92_015328 [Papaver armeniacum]